MTDKAGLLQYWFFPCVFLRLKIFFLLNSFNIFLLFLHSSNLHASTSR